MAAATAIIMMAIPVMAGRATTQIRAVVAGVFAIMFGTQAVANDLIDDKCECETGITSMREGYLQCWICPADQHVPYTRRTAWAKSRIENLGGCQVPPTHSLDDIYARISAFYDGVKAREAENACWFPEGKGHKMQVEAYRNAIVKCERILKANHGIR